MSANEVTLRRGTEGDSRALFSLFMRTYADLIRRQGQAITLDREDPAVVEQFWTRRQALFDHLARTAYEYWVAEKEEQPIGYARSILRDGSLELTEFFVAPESQSTGIGRTLLARAFPAGFRQRTIIATTDSRAQVRYLKSGVYPRFPVYYFHRAPRSGLPPSSSLEAVPIQATIASLDELARIDGHLVGYRRDVDHQWLMVGRRGFFYQREGRVIGYGYLSTGTGSGPFALLDPQDYAAVLGHAESVLAQEGIEDFGIQVPMINEEVARYVASNGFELGPDVLLYMSDREIGQLGGYIITSPPFFM